MLKIDIIGKNELYSRIFIFKVEVDVYNDFRVLELKDAGDQKCSYCGITINYAYVYIIHQLKKKGLLSKDYGYLCCTCYDGLMYEGVEK